MPLKILQLKFKILSRILGELTFFGKVVLLALCAAALYAVYELTGLAPQRFQVAGAAAAILLLVHLGRKDYAFCRRILPHPFRLFVLEYSLGVIPFVVIALLREQLLLAMLYAALPPLVAAVPRTLVQCLRRVPLAALPTQRAAHPWSLPSFRLGGPPHVAPLAHPAMPCRAR